MLGVFFLAITPWSALHHHEEVSTTVEKNCTHHFHVKVSKEACLICKAHFEKNYTVANNFQITYLQSKFITYAIEISPSSYTQLISTSLRGPPSVS